MSTREVGDRAEAFARDLLEREGYRIAETNVRTPMWELDIVAWEGEVLCFVEVRSTATLDQGGPFATVTHDKQRRITRAAKAYLMMHEEIRDVEVRFDVVGIWGNPFEHDLIRGAFVCAS